VPCSKAPRKSLLTTYFTKQVWNYTSFQAFIAQVIQNSLWGFYTVYSNKSIPALENSMLPQYPGCWSDLEEEICQLHTTVAMTGKSKLLSSEWPVYSSKIVEQTMYLSYTIFIRFSLLFDKQFHFRFQNNKTWIQYFGSISTYATFFKNNNSNVSFLQCILLSSFATQFYWYLERCSIIILHRCHLLHLCMLVSSTAFVQN